MITALKDLESSYIVDFTKHLDTAIELQELRNKKEFFEVFQQYDQLFKKIDKNKELEKEEDIYKEKKKR
jgi:hypothetical protein